MLYDSQFIVLCVILLFAMNALNLLFIFYSFFLFEYVIVSLFCVQQWVASNVPFWPPSYLIK